MKILLLLILTTLKTGGQAQIVIKSKIDTTIGKGLRTVTYYSQVFKNDFLITENKLIQIYYLNGRLEETFSIALGDIETGTHFKFYKNGEAKEIYNVINNRKVGTYVIFYDNGKPKITGQYKNIQCLNEITETKDSSAMYDKNNGQLIGIKFVSSVKSIKTGTWFYYNQKGLLVKKEEYLDDGSLRQ